MKKWMEKEKERRKNGRNYHKAAYAVMLCLPLLLAGCAGNSPQGNGGNAQSTREQEAEGQTVQEQDVQTMQGQDEQTAQGQTMQGRDEQTVQGQDGQTVQGQTMQGQQEQPSQASSPDSPVQDAQRDAQSDIGIEQAKEAALAHAGMEAASVTFTKEKLDHDDGIARYEIEFVTDTTKYEYEINASDAVVMEASLEPIEQISATVEQQDIITLEEAKAAALDYAGMSAEQVRFTKIEQDYDDGMTEYEIEFYVNGKEYSFAIDAVTGSVLEMEIEMD